VKAPFGTRTKSPARLAFEHGDDESVSTLHGRDEDEVPGLGRDQAARRPPCADDAGVGLHDELAAVHPGEPTDVVIGRGRELAGEILHEASSVTSDASGILRTRSRKLKTPRFSGAARQTMDMKSSTQPTARRIAHGSSRVLRNR
jgi:hypothetical protein